MAAFHKWIKTMTKAARDNTVLDMQHPGLSLYLHYLPNYVKLTLALKDFTEADRWQKEKLVTGVE